MNNVQLSLNYATPNKREESTRREEDHATSVELRRLTGKHHMSGLLSPIHLINMELEAFLKAIFFKKR